VRRDSDAGGRGLRRRGSANGGDLYSPSRLEQFENCPKKFEYRYIQKIPAESESIEGFVGKRVHEVLERLYKVARHGRVPSLAKVLHRFRALWDEHFDPGRVRVVREGMSTAFYQETGERCLSNYYRRHYPFDADETLGLEERLVFALDDAGAYRIQGIVDRVVRAPDGALEIHDYKTGARVPRQQQLDRDRQLGLYHLGAAQRYGDDRPIRLVWHYLASNQVRRSSRTSAQLQALREETIGLIDRIRANTSWEPTPGPLCPWCEYRDRCPAQGGAAADGRDSSAPQAAAGRAQRAPGERSHPLEQLELL
jgi:putative RecB family exonuclease